MEHTVNPSNSNSPSTSTGTTYPNVLPLELHSLEDLNWQALSEELIQHCKTEGGQTLWQTTPFLCDTEAVALHLNQVDAVTQIRLRDGEPILDAPHIISHIQSIQRTQKGITLSALELGKLTENIRLQRQLFGWFKQGYQHIGRPDSLKGFIESTGFPVHVYEPLSEVFEADGRVYDSASDNLMQLREQLYRLKNRITEQMQGVMQRHARQLQDQIITERDGRAVLSVQVAFKNQVKGIIHDMSASGATVFIEPQSVVPLNNERRLTEKAIEDEIAKLCRKYSELIGEHGDDLIQFYNQLSQLDRRYAAAELSIQLDSQIQTPKDDAQFTLTQMRHPLLLLRMQDSKEGQNKVIGNDLSLGNSDKAQALVVTGPNTGGKTVLLKTIGLCAWMHRAGLPLPTQHQPTETSRTEDSNTAANNTANKMGFFQPILSDIGDHQDLSQDLSSFSGHLNRIQPWLDNTTSLNKALVLMDEVGTGTDPQEGSALAQAVMEHLVNEGATLAVTTHLENLKNIALTDTRFINARVTFDLENLQPTYQLVLGIPGTSHALHIAQQSGIPASLIKKAESFLSQRDRQTANLLGTLEAQHHSQSQTEEKYTQWEAELHQRQSRLEQLEYKLNERKDQFQQTTQAQVRERVYEMDRYIKRLKRQLQQQERDEELNEGSLNRAEKGLDKRSGRVLDTLQKNQGPPVTEADLSIGLMIQSKQLQCQGVITKIQAKKKTVVMDNNGIPMAIPFADIRLLHIPITRPKAKKKTNSQRISKGPQPKQPRVSPKENEDFGLPTQSIKLLGLRVDDAIAELEQFMDNALRGGHQTIAVIHGHGTGALKKAVRSYLREHQKKGHTIKRFGPAPQESGGDGQTLVQLM